MKIIFSEYSLVAVQFNSIQSNFFCLFYQTWIWNKNMHLPNDLWRSTLSTATGCIFLPGCSSDIVNVRASCNFVNKKIVIFLSTYILGYQLKMILVMDIAGRCTLLKTNVFQFIVKNVLTASLDIFCRVNKS